MVEYQTEPNEFQALKTIWIYVVSLDSTALPRLELLTVLHGQLTLLRKRAEQGIPVSAECIARAEELARSLECSS